MSRPAASELAAAAAALDGARPEVAAWLRELAQPEPDGRRFRREVLRRCHRVHLFGMARTTAARYLATWWATLDRERPAKPGSIPAELMRLDRAGVSPVSHRTIVDDLDPSLD